MILLAVPVHLVSPQQFEQRKRNVDVSGKYGARGFGRLYGVLEIEPLEGIEGGVCDLELSKMVFEQMSSRSGLTLYQVQGQYWLKCAGAELLTV
jgi:hypothetical protein